jgi:hypothetical protein
MKMVTVCPCFSCGKQLDYLTFGKNSLMEIDGAIEVVVEGGYGSKFDLAQMLIWICDECIEQKMKERVFMINEDIDYSYEQENEDNV